jgi:DNA polymerase-3 subunit alpha
VRRPIEELIDSREPQLLAGIVTDFRVINGQRGKLALFKLDDKSGVIDARADEALINANRTCSRTTNSSSSWASCSRTVSRAACN